LKGGIKEMGEPYRYKKKLMKVGTAMYCLIPADWKHHDKKEVIVEVYDDRVVIRPAK